MPDKVAAFSGAFITFEGGEGSGKTTHIRFLADSLRKQGYEVVCVREPGGTKVGEALRDILLGESFGELSDQAELLVFEAARAQIVSEVIAPALLRGAVVLCDRFCDSTIAYQGYGRGLSLDFIKRASDFACQGIYPTRTILMCASDEASIGLRRATHIDGADRMERAGLEFHERVNRAFKEIAQDDPDRVRIVTSKCRKSLTARKIFFAVSDIFGWDPDNLPFDDAFFSEVENYHGKRQAGKRGK